MPGDGDFVYANDLIAVLKKKYAAKAYKKMVHTFSTLLNITETNHSAYL